MMNYIILPVTNRKVYEGSTVVLNRLPRVKWILSCGFYTYNDKQKKGWYFEAIPSGNVMPVFTEDLYDIKIITPLSPVDPPIAHIPPEPTPGPTPPGPKPIEFTEEDKEMIMRSTITVDSLEERDKLSSHDLPEGKVVRVNDVEGHVDYFEWDRESENWIPATLGRRYMTKAEIESAIGPAIVDIEYKDDEGILALVAYNQQEIELALNGLAKEPTYNEHELQLRIPVIGQEDFTLTIPKDVYIQTLTIVPDYDDDGTIHPALVLSIEENGNERDIVADATSIYNSYIGSDTSTVTVNITSGNVVSATARISLAEGNALSSSQDGLFVDISGKVDKVTLSEDYILVSDGLGGFTKAGNGLKVFTEGSLEDVSNKGVVTANLITQGINAAIQAIDIDSINNRISQLEQAQVGEGAPGHIVISTASGVTRSELTPGSDTLSDSSNTLAKESAVVDAFQWKTFK